MMSDSDDNLANAVVLYLNKALNAPAIPPLPSGLEDIPGIRELAAEIKDLREYMVLIAKGDLSHDLSQRGFLAGLLKKHVANLRHMTWQVEQVSQGDFTQRLDFMGEFSASFNNMVLQLDTTLKNLRATEEDLTKLTKALTQEVELRSAAVKALEKSKARFQYLADHDPLTGALNRRSFLQIAQDGLEQARQRGSACCVGMLDVDYFKQFNDNHGHVAGDSALKHVVQICTRSLRQKDFMGRYGGEEFVFFFDDTDIKIGRTVANRIRRAIHKSPVQLDTEKVAISVSMGVSVVLPDWPDERNDMFMQKVVATADAALYRAKQGGRNRVCIAPVQHPDRFENEAAANDKKNE